MFARFVLPPYGQGLAIAHIIGACDGNQRGWNSRLKMFCIRLAPWSYEGAGAR